jgi:hypothetical protein
MVDPILTYFNNGFQYLSILSQGLMMSHDLDDLDPQWVPGHLLIYGLLEIVDVQWTDAGGSLE